MIPYGSSRYIPPDEPPYILDVPRQTITFNLQAVSGKQPPNPPVISGDQTVTTGQLESYSFVATDPDSDTIAYDVDWDNNGTVDQRLPAVDFIPSGTSQSQAKSWVTTGTKTFQARTRDVDGLLSTWTTYTVTVVDGVTIASCSASPSTITAGQSATWSATVSGGAAPYSYRWAGTDGVTGSGTTLTQTYLLSGNKSVTLTVTDAVGAVTTKTCGVLVVNSGTPPPNPPPGSDNDDNDVDISVNKPLVRKGEEVTITWDTGTDDPASCVIVPYPGGAVNASTGTVSVVVNNATLYYLICPNGTDSVQIRVLPTIQES
jgi:hypothetical protein